MCDYKGNAISGDSLSAALEDLGLLSQVTNSRKEYLQETENFYSRLGTLTMNDSSQSSSSNNSGSNYSVGSTSSRTFFNFINSDKDRTQGSVAGGVQFPCSSGSNTQDQICNEVRTSSSPEKENSMCPGFRVLECNSNFVTSFKAHKYTLPSYFSYKSKQPRSYIPVFKLKRKKARNHPYLSTGINNFKSRIPIFSPSSTNVRGESEMDSSYRLRTTSLSSGTCGMLAKSKNRRTKQDNVAAMSVTRSRSMEDLSGDSQSLPENSEAFKIKDVENVSKAIQLLCVQDNG